MNKTNTFLILFFGMIMTVSQSIYAQDKPLQKIDNGPIPSLLVLNSSKTYSLDDSESFIKETINPNTATDFELLKTESDPLGFEHSKMQQYFKDIKVEFATLNINSIGGKIESLSSAYFPIAEDFDVSANISRSEAFNAALAHVGANTYLWQNPEEAALLEYSKPEGELVIFPVMDNISRSNRLAYKFDIYALAPLYRAEVYIDAKTSQFIFENKRIHHANVPATGTSLYNGTVSFTADNTSGPYRLRQTEDGNGIQTFDLKNGTSYNNAVDITSGSTHFTGNATGVQAHYGAEQTYKYYYQKYGRNSFDNSGAIIKSYVSYGVNYVNAFWDGSRMTYGDGDGWNYGPLVSLDICGHEISHGVTEYSANLVYSYQSGALNESFSDIFGESIEKFATGTNDWLMGEDIGAGGSGGALRSMSNPKAFGQPDTFQGINWYLGSNDSGGVHTNSGVQNFWFYILSVGKSGTNDLGNSYNVTGIGMEKAAAIAYRNLTVHLRANSQYIDARNGAIQAARELYGHGSPEEIATTNAWYAVGVGTNYQSFIGGSNLICATAGSSNYTIEGALPPYTWSVSNNLKILPNVVIMPSGGSNKIRVKSKSPNTRASGYVQVSHNNGVTRKDIWIGKPLLDVELTPDISQPEKFVNFELTSNHRDNQEVATVVYQKTGGNGNLHVSNKFGGRGSGPVHRHWFIDVTAQITNSCGTTTLQFRIEPPPPPLKQVSPIPNSADDSFNLDFSELKKDTYTIEIYDAFAQKQYVGKSENSIKKIETSHFPTGIYLIKILDSKGNTTNQNLIIYH